MADTPASETTLTIENTALELDQIIGAPLRAIVDAQKQSADATIQFIYELTQKVGDNEDKRSLINVEFQYNRLVQDSEKGTEIQQQSLVVPLLTLVPPPFLSVDEAEINFNTKIITHKEKEESGKGKKIALYSIYSSSEKTKTDVTSDMQVKIKIKRSEIPEGLAKALTVVNNAVIVQDQQ